MSLASRSAAVFASLALATALIASDQKPRLEFMVQSGDSTFMNDSGALDSASLRNTYGDHFAAFVKDGKRYVITNRQIVDQIEQQFAPVAELAKKQGKLAGKQGKLAGEQGRLAASQAAVAAEEAARISAGQYERKSGDSEARQRDLARQQRELGDQQHALGEEQKKLGEQQKSVAHDVEAKVASILDAALKSGAAVPVK